MSWDAWHDALQEGMYVDKRIVDEYGLNVSLVSFEEMVENSRHLPRHTDEYPEGSFLDDEGYPFIIGEFS